MSELVARMGEAHATRAAGDTLACIGLGSCIGLILVDRSQTVAAMAHVMLPEASEPEPRQPGKFADTAVPALVELMQRHGANPGRIEAALVGGAAMFSFGSSGSGQDIGARNEAAVRAALEERRIPIRATATGGGKGRTVRVNVGAPFEVYVREAGGADEPLRLEKDGCRRTVTASHDLGTTSP